MKRQFSFLWVVFALSAALAGAGCGPSSQISQTPTSGLVKVDCFNASAQGIMDLLRSGRGRDIAVRNADGATMEITVAFSPADTPAWKLAQILRDLNGLSGVIHVEVMENPSVIRQSF